MKRYIVGEPYSIPWRFERLVRISLMLRRAVERNEAAIDEVARRYPNGHVLRFRQAFPGSVFVIERRSDAGPQRNGYALTTRPASIGRSDLDLDGVKLYICHRRRQVLARRRRLVLGERNALLEEVHLDE